MIMNKAILFDFIVDKEAKKINVSRSFNAPLELVWAAWTDASILDLWWAPKPWKTETKSMNFREGGRWHYAMVGPEGERHWCLFDYDEIEPERRYSGQDSFCDENEVLSTEMPRMRWNNKFAANEEERTMVNVEVSFDKLEDLDKIIEMGFKEGFTMGMTNLDEYLDARLNRSAGS